MHDHLDAVVFDMDGTLIDSSAAAPDAYIHALRELGGPELQRSDIIDRYPLGPPPYIFADIFGRAAEGHELDTFHRHMEVFSKDVPVYPGVVELLEELVRRGVRIAVFTGASDDSARMLLTGSMLHGHFELVLGCDAYTPKPSPEGVIAALEKMGVAPDRAAYVGDSPLDQLAARDAGALAVSAGWGHLFDPNSPADLIANTPADVLRLLDQEFAR